MKVVNSETKNIGKHDFKPSYTWPNPAFPFRVYYESQKCRIFIIENIQHNWKWMSEWHQNFRKTDFFFVYCGWYHSPSFAKEAEKIFSVLNLDKKQFFFLYNCPLEMENFAAKGFQGDVINQNAWIDENLVMRPLNLDKIYNAIYVGRRSAFKRHFLASQVPQLALIAGNNHGNTASEIPPYKYLNDRQLSSEEVCEKINQAYCGLILSETEGACFASSEYLLCGVPVVSTPSKGGRHVWYDEYNSIICEPTPDAVASAVEEFVRNPRYPKRIRQKHIEEAQKYRTKFINVLTDIFNRFGVVDVDPGNYFHGNFFHKLRKSYKPNFPEIFGN
ncbi:glycosyltransferase [Dapis sp. BLCC M229]